MRSKCHASASRARQRLLELCGQPTDGAVQVVDTIDVEKEQGLTAAEQTGTCTAADISVMWVPDATGQFQPYQLLPGVSATSSSSSYTDTSCTHSTDTASWQLQQLNLLQQQQRLCTKVLNGQGEMQQLQQHKGSQEVWQHNHNGSAARLDEQHTTKPNSQQLAELQAAAATAAQVAAQHRFCNDCGATIALTWHWYKSSSRSSSRSHGKHNNNSRQHCYVLCQVCSNHLRSTGCHRRFSRSPSVAAGPAVLAAACAAAAAAAVAADPRVNPDGEQLRSAGSKVAVTAAAECKMDPHSEQQPTAEAAATAETDTAAQAVASAAADPTAKSASKQQLPAPATAAAANAAVNATVNAAVRVPAENPTRTSDSKQQLTAQATAAAAAPAVQQRCQNIRGAAAGSGSLTPAGQLSLRSCSNCSRGLAVADCSRGHSVRDQPVTSQQQQQKQQQVQQQQLCDQCQLYEYVAGAARPVSAEELSANQAGARQVTAAWQGLQQWQQKLKQQQQQAEKEGKVRAKGVKRPRSQAAAASARKRAAGLSEVGAKTASIAQQVPRPSHSKQQQKQQQHKCIAGTAAAPAVAAGSKLSNSTPPKTAAVADAGPAKGSTVAKTSKNMGSKHPPKFKELKRNVFVHRQRVQLDSQDVIVCSCQPQLGHCCSSEHGCLNHLCKVSCTPGHCPVGDDVCRNMVLFKRQFPSTKLVDLGPKGWGMVAVEDIIAGTIVAEYTGEVVNVSEGKKRLAQYAAEGLKHTYIMDLSKSEVIDATKKGGIARFINHSCEPNCKTEKWQVGGEVVVAIKATKRIPAGTEITYDYRYQSHDLPHARTRCCCGTAGCTGWLGDFDPHEHLQAELDEDDILEAERLTMSYTVIAEEIDEETSE